jgi:hypothetical protein
VVEEERRVQPLARQPPLHVGERDDDGVDLLGGDVGAQPFEGQLRRAAAVDRARHGVLPVIR